jgi:hypothetical protein
MMWKMTLSCRDVAGLRLGSLSHIPTLLPALSFLALFSPLPVTAGAPETQAVGKGTSVSDDVRFISEQVRTTYERVSDVSYSFHTVVTESATQHKSEFDGNAEQRTSLGDQLVTQKQDFSDSTGARSSVSVRGYVGPTSSASWYQGNSWATEYEYSDPTLMSDVASGGLITFSCPHPELKGFGNGRQLVWDLLSRAESEPAMYRWKAVRDRGAVDQTVWHLLMYETATGIWPNLPTLDLTVNPDRGFGVTHIAERMPEAPYPLIRETEIVLADVRGDRSFYPSHILEQYYDLQSRGVPTEITDVVLRNVRVRSDLRDSDFSIDKLELPEGTGLLRVAADGTRTQLHWTKDGPVQDSSTGAPPSEVANTATPISSTADAANEGPTKRPYHVLVFGVVFVVLAVVLGVLGSKRRLLP